MRRLPLAGILLLMLSGCQPPPEPPPNLDLGAWTGRPISEVVATWGEPSMRSEAGKGFRYTWPATHYGERSLPVNRSASGGPDDRQDLEEFRCKAVFVTDAAGTIREAVWRGEGCGMRD